MTEINREACDCVKYPGMHDGNRVCERWERHDGEPCAHPIAGRAPAFYETAACGHETSAAYRARHRGETRAAMVARQSHQPSVCGREACLHAHAERLAAEREARA
jgi:hypothetical protein